jgi:hypothetical protein
MISFSLPENIAALRNRLKAINPAFEEFEVEELILYPSVEERPNNLKADYVTWHRPESIFAEHYLPDFMPETYIGMLRQNAANNGGKL